MVKIYICDVSLRDREPDAFFTEHFPNRFKKAQAVNDCMHRNAFLSVSSMLYRVLGIDERDILFGDCGKPYCPKGPNFNVSHSGKHCVLAVSDAEIGVDIEEINPRKSALLDRIGSKEELEWAVSKGDDAFFDLWTLKEAYLKMKGRGITTHMNEVKVLKAYLDGHDVINGEDVYAKSIRYGDYVISVFSKAPIGELRITEVK